MFGMAANEPPFDQVFGVRSIGWWGMTETVSQGIIGDALLRNRPMTTGRPAPGYGIRILRPDRTPVAPGETGHLECWGVARHPDVPRVPQQPAGDGGQLHARRLVHDRRPRDARDATATSPSPTATRTC